MSEDNGFHGFVGNEVDVAILLLRGKITEWGEKLQADNAREGRDGLHPGDYLKLIMMACADEIASQLCQPVTATLFSSDIAQTIVQDFGEALQYGIDYRMGTQEEEVC